MCFSQVFKKFGYQYRFTSTRSKPKKLFGFLHHQYLILKPAKIFAPQKYTTPNFYYSFIHSFIYLFIYLFIF